MSTLDGPRTLLTQFVERKAIRTLLGAFLTGRGDTYRMVLALYVLELWLRSNLTQTTSYHESHGAGVSPRRT